MTMGVGGGFDSDLEELQRLRMEINALELQFSVCAARFAAGPSFEVYDGDGPISWIKRECRMAGSDAARAICIGAQLERTPECAQAMLAGQIGIDHLGLIAYSARALTESPTSSGFDEKALLAKARHSSVLVMRKACAQYRHAMDPEAYVNGEREAAEQRALSFQQNPDGLVNFEGSLDNESGVKFQQAVESLLGPNDGRPLYQRRGDALAELIDRSVSSGQLPVRGGVRPHVQVVATIETLAQVAGAPAAELDGGFPLSAVALERLTCDCSLTRVLLNSESQVIDLGRARRTISPSQRRALLARDLTCRWPGCERPGRYCDGHHLRHWARDGESDVGNLILLCPRHHFCVHEGGWLLVGSIATGFLAIPPKPWWRADLPAA